MIEVRDLVRFQLDLNELKKSVRNRYVRQAAQAGARVVLREMRRRARAKDKSDTGALARSLRAVTRTNKRTGSTMVLVGPLRGFALTGSVRDRRFRTRKGQPPKTRKVNRVPARYVHLLEGGTDPHWVVYRHKKGKVVRWRHPGTEAEPIAKPTYEAVYDEAVSVFQQKIGELVSNHRFRT